jgi:hypothetical protein
MVEIAVAENWVLYAENAVWMQAQFRWIVLFIFLYIILDLQQKQCHNWKEHKFLSMNNINISHLVFIWMRFSALEEHGDTQA